MFKYFSDKEQLLKERKKTQLLTARQSSAETVNAITFVTLAQNGVIDGVTASEHTDLFSPWVVGMRYQSGDMRQHNGVLYRCTQSHTSQEDWTPDTAVSLWAKVSDPTNEYPDWSQPVGAHDAYAKGDKVTYNGNRFVSVVDNNVWAPDVYGWSEDAHAE